MDLSRIWLIVHANTQTIAFGQTLQVKLDVDGKITAGDVDSKTLGVDLQGWRLMQPFFSCQCCSRTVHVWYGTCESSCRASGLLTGRVRRRPLHEFEASRSCY